ncbi:MAG TPA: hypothetical protein EYO59_11280 [Chromatiaceae bacterium]|nr:hypothetical protein [Chromatiaceae bacterium]
MERLPLREYATILLSVLCISKSGCEGTAVFLYTDAATAEISRTQIWQWLRHRAQLANGETLTKKFFLDLVSEELENINKIYYDRRTFNHKLVDATELFLSLCTSHELEEFLTSLTYELILKEESNDE